MLQMQRFCCELPSAPVHQIHAKSIRCYCVVLNLELHRICNGHHLAVKCIGKFYNSADCAIVPGTEARARSMHSAHSVQCAHDPATTNISSLESQTTDKTSIIIFQCVAASRHVDGDFYLLLAAPHLRFVVVCNAVV